MNLHIKSIKLQIGSSLNHIFQFNYLDSFKLHINFSLKTGLGDSESEDILIPGRVWRNRAVDGDLVAVQLLPKSEWKSKINRLGVSTTSNDKDDDEEEEKWERRAGTNRLIDYL